MSATAYYQPTFEYLMGTKQVELLTDTLMIGLANGTLPARGTTEAWEYVSSLTASLTEVSTSGTGYSRQALTSVTLSQSGLVYTLNSANPAWTSATFSAAYAFLYDSTVGSGDSSHPLMIIFDLGGSQSVSGSEFTLTVNASGLVQWTAAQ